MTASGTSSSIPWYRAAFGRSYLTVYRRRDEDDARRLGELLSVIGWDCRGQRVLDIGCGHGRHLQVLEEGGARAYGIDLSRALLAEARRLGRGRRIALADMRALPFRNRVFDLALFLFTTFGYFESDEEHAEVLAETARVLKPGGRLLIDLPNPARLRATLVPHSRRTVDSLVVIETRRIDDAAGRIEKNVEVTDPADPSAPPERWTESVRLWTPDDLGGMLARAGFRVSAVAGGFDGAPFSAESSGRMIFLAEVLR
jgi:SAM-dependent methyltransferase